MMRDGTDYALMEFTADTIPAGRRLKPRPDDGQWAAVSGWWGEYYSALLAEAIMESAEALMQDLA